MVEFSSYDGSCTFLRAMERPMEPSPSLFYVTLPKSGTNFTETTIPEITDLKRPEMLSDPKIVAEIHSGYQADVAPEYFSIGDFNNQWLFLDGVRRYLPNGYIFGAHMRASYHNIRTLREAGCKKVTVLIREPRDNVISWTHHLNNMGEVNRNQNSKIQHLPKNYYQWPFAEQLSFQVRTFLPAAVNFIESWLGVFEEAYDDLSIRLVYFDELKRERREYFERIFRFHGIKNYDLDKIPTPVRGQRHYRKGTHGQWVDDFSEQDKTFAELLLGNRLKTAFDNAALHHRSYNVALDPISQGPYRAALGFAKVIEQFPYFTEAYDRLNQVWEQVANHFPSGVTRPEAPDGEIDHFIRPQWVVENLPLILDPHNSNGSEVE